MAKRYTKGQRVIVRGNPREDIPEVHGVVEQEWDPDTETYIIRADPQYVTPDDPDAGLLECTQGWIRAE